MKRYDLDTLLDHMEEHPKGEWVRYDDANAWWQEMKELPRVEDVIKIAELEKELEPLRLGRDFWNSVDQRHPAVELLKTGAALWLEWRSTDITEDDDRWVGFTDRAHRHHDAIVGYLRKIGVKS